MAGGSDWHAALTSSLCICAKLMYDKRVFCTDVLRFTERYSKADLIRLERQAVAGLYPYLGSGLNRGTLAFRSSLLSMALDNNLLAKTMTTPGRAFEFNILIANSDEQLRVEHEGLARAMAPNASVHSVDSYAAALAYADAQAVGGTPVHLLLLGSSAGEASLAATAREVAELVNVIDPSARGSLYTDMRSKPLIAVVSELAQLLGDARNDLYLQGVDAVMSAKELTAGSLQVLLDFSADEYELLHQRGSSKCDTPAISRRSRGGRLRANR